MSYGIRGVSPRDQISQAYSSNNKNARWLPSLPRLSSSIEAFHSLAKRFQSSALPLNDKTLIDLQDLVEQQKAAKCFSCNIRKAAALTLLMSYALFRYIQSQTNSSSVISTTSHDLDLAIGATVMGVFRQNIGRTLLSSSSLSNYSILATEELPVSQSFNTWSVFPFQNQGRLIASTTSTLPAGISLVQSQMQTLNTLNIPNSYDFIAQGNALYVAIHGGVNTINILNTASIQNIYTANILSVGTAINDMCIIGETLYVTGTNKLLKIFDISQPFSPVLIGETPFNSINGNTLASVGTSTQFGCLTSTGFSCIDASNPSNPQPLGSIPGLIGNGIAASDNYYYVGTSTGLAIVNATNPLLPLECNFLPTAYVHDVKYDNGCCYLGTSSGIITVNVQNPMNLTKMNTLPFFGGAQQLLSSGNFMYSIAQSSGIGIIDTRNTSNLITSVSNIFPGISGLYHATTLGDNLVLGSSNNALVFVTGQDSFSFSGTPTAGSKGSYTVQLKATTLSGGTINNTQLFDVNILPIITSSSPIPNLIGAVSQVVNAIINPHTFIHGLGLPMTYNLECDSGNADWITLNPVSGQLSGTPTTSDVGSTTCVVTATDNLDASGMSSPFNINVFYGPTITVIPNQIAIIGQTFSLQLAATSKDPSSEFTLSVSDLPSSFTYENRTISGIPSTNDLGTYPITVTATDGNGISNTKSFTFNVVTPGVPVFLNPISSQTIIINSPFSIDIPAEAAVNPNNPNIAITYSAKLTDDSSLPSWMKFDGTKFYGTPPSTAIFFSNVVYAIALTATQTLSDNLQTTTSMIFNITVTGNSLVKTITTVGAPIASAVTILFAARVAAYNCCIRSSSVTNCINRVKKVFCCSKPKAIFQQGGAAIFKGQDFKYLLKTARSEISGFKTLYDGKPCPDGHLPYWLENHYDSETKGSKLVTRCVPDFGPVQSIKVIVIDEKGYDLEEVILTPTNLEDQHLLSEQKIPEPKGTSVELSIMPGEQKSPTAHTPLVTSPIAPS